MILDTIKKNYSDLCKCDRCGYYDCVDVAVHHGVVLFRCDRCVVTWWYWQDLVEEIIYQKKPANEDPPVVSPQPSQVVDAGDPDPDDPCSSVDLSGDPESGD